MISSGNKLVLVVNLILQTSLEPKPVMWTITSFLKWEERKCQFVLHLREKTWNWHLNNHESRIFIYYFFFHICFSHAFFSWFIYCFMWFFLHTIHLFYTWSPDYYIYFHIKNNTWFKYSCYFFFTIFLYLQDSRFNVFIIISAKEIKNDFFMIFIKWKKKTLMYLGCLFFIRDT